MHTEDPDDAVILVENTTDREIEVTMSFDPSRGYPKKIVVRENGASEAFEEESTS